MELQELTTNYGKDLVTPSDITTLGLNMSEMSHKDIERVIRTVAYFRLNTLQNLPKWNAYQIAFDINDIPKNTASARACGIERNSVFKAIAFAMGNDIHLTMMSDRIKVLNKMSSIALDGEASDRDAINASEVFLKYTLPPEQKEVIDDKAYDVMAEIVSKIDASHKSDTAMLENLTLEDIIDVEE